MTLEFEGEAIAFRDGETALTALARAGHRFGGFVCGTGDCTTCVAEVDGVAWTRLCRTATRTNLRIRRHTDDAAPPLPVTTASADAPPVRNVHADLAVIGRGRSGAAAIAGAEADGSTVVSFEAADREEVVGVFPGPLVVARTDEAMIHAHVDRVIVATGSMAIPPVCAGTDLAGVMSPHAHAMFTAAGVDLGTVVRIDEPPVRIEGTDGRVSAVHLSDGSVVACDTVVVDLGRVPRDRLARMASPGDAEVAGQAAAEPDLPTCPAEGVVCPCNGTTVDDLDTSWERGFDRMELLKRSSLAGTGTCQGAQCIPYLKAFLHERTGAVEDAFTARPVAYQPTLSELSAGRQFPAHPRTALHADHVALGATMDRIGGWWRPWTYGDTDAECRAVRQAVSIGDVGTLGKFVLQGPDAQAALQWLFPTDVSTIRPGRARYVLMLDERGHVLDDGMIMREPADAAGGDRFYLTVTSGGANLAEMWFQDWTSHLDVRWMNVTMALGAINVTGPRTTELLSRLGLDEPLPMLTHANAAIAGVPCRVARLSFTGEISYELHHPWDRSSELWRALLSSGSDLGIAPHGLEALTRLRLEKGHVIVGQDTDYDSTPRRIDHEWAVNLGKGDFVGRHAVERTDRIPLDKQLVGFVADGPAPFEGAVLRHVDDDSYAGYITSSARSDTLDQAVMLGWLYLRDGELVDSVRVDDPAAAPTARRAPVPFLDPEGARARA